MSRVCPSCLLVLAALLSVAASARAGEPAEVVGAPFELPAVVVEGEREPKALEQDRAAAGTVLLRDDLDDAAESLPEVLDQQVGVRVLRLGGPGSLASLSIRGSRADQVLVTLDGIPLNSSTGGPVDLSRLPLGHLDRVEVYRGASPLGSGSSAIGGVLALRTRAGTSRRVAAALGGGSFGAREARLLVTEPFARGDLLAGLDYSGSEGTFPFTHDGGTRFDPSDDTRVTRANNRHDQVNALAKGRLLLGKRWQATALNWFFWRAQGVPGLGLYQTGQSHLGTWDELAVARVEGFGLADGRLDLAAAAALRVSETRLSDPLSEVGLGVDDSRDRSCVPDATLDAAWRPFARWELKAHGGYRYERFDPGGASQLAGVGSQRHLGTLAAESGWTLPGVDLLVLTSGRLEVAASRALGGATGTAPGEPAGGEPTLHGTWRAALVHDVLPHTRLRASGGSAVRLPSLFELFGNTGAVLGNPGLVPEHAWSVDGGVEHSLAWLPEPHRARVGLGAWWSEVDDLIQFVTTAQGVSRAENVERARLWGLEAEAAADLFGHWRTDVNYTLTQAKSHSHEAARAGKALPLRPASRWHVGTLVYQGPWGWFREVSLGAEVDWTAGNYLDPANLAWAPHRLYVGLTAALEIRPAHLRLALAARNLGGDQTLDLTGYPLPGRSFSATLSGEWSP